MIIWLNANSRICIDYVLESIIIHIIRISIIDWASQPIKFELGKGAIFAIRKERLFFK